MLKALSKPRSPHFYRALMFKIIVLSAVAALFWTSAPARQVAADVLDSASDIIEPKAQSPGQQIDAFINQFTN